MSRNRDLMTEALDELPEWDASGESETCRDTPVVHLFMVDAAAHWFVSEKDTSKPDDIRYFGLCDLGLGFPELGWIDRHSLMSVTGKYGLPVEFDEHGDGYTMEKAHKRIGKAVPSWMPE